MQYKKKLPDVDPKEVEDKIPITETRQIDKSESQMICILVFTSLVFVIMMILQLSIIFRDNYTEPPINLPALLTFDFQVPILSPLLPFMKILKTRDPSDLVTVYYDKYQSSVRFNICTSLDDFQRYMDCVGLTSVNDGYQVSVPPKMTALGNNKVILSVVWKKIAAPGAVPSGTVEVYVVDTNEDKKPIVFHGPYDNETLWTSNPFEIIPYQNKFDIFVKSSEFCSPPGSMCIIRNNDEGKWLGTYDFPFETRNNAFNLEKLLPLQTFNSTAGYVYISKQNSTVRLLNQYLEVVREKIVIGAISSYSVKNGHIAICTIVNRQNPFTSCVTMDQQLEVKKEYVLRNQKANYDWKLYNLESGDALAIAVSRGFPVVVQAKLLTSDGQISKPKYFEAEECLANNDPFDQFIELPQQYCFSFTCYKQSVTYCLDSFDSLNSTLRQI